MVETLRRYFAEHADGIVAAYLFGSHARGTAKPRSDVDVAVLFETPSPPTIHSPRFRLAADLESVVRRAVDLVELNRAPADLVHRVLRDGIILLDRDRSARIAFEVRLRNEYFDMAPIRALYRRVSGV